MPDKHMKPELFNELLASAGEAVIMEHDIVRCRACHGTGQHDHEPCPNCNGTGTVRGVFEGYD